MSAVSLITPPGFASMADGTRLAFVTGGQEKAIWVYRDALQALRATP